MSPQEFFDKYKDWAIETMAKSGVPASITLAQAAIESGWGESRLAKIANNFFGIKLHSWIGDYVLANDDKPNEKFRKYKTAYDSFIDHADFLMTNKRYDSLFDSTDYKKWAEELQKAGYATAQTYANSLISTIEKYGLDKYDKQGDVEMKSVPNTIIRNRRKIYLVLAIAVVVAMMFIVWKKFIK